MVLSNPLHGPRLKGCVGQSLPGVRVRVVDDEEQVVVESDGQGVIVERMKGGSSSSSSSSGADGSGSDNDGTPGVGELRVKSAGVFSQYLHRPEATAESFDKVTHPYINTHPEYRVENALLEHGPLLLPKPSLLPSPNLTRLLCVIRMVGLKLAILPCGNQHQHQG